MASIISFVDRKRDTPKNLGNCLSKWPSLLYVLEVILLFINSHATYLDHVSWSKLNVIDDTVEKSWSLMIMMTSTYFFSFWNKKKSFGWRLFYIKYIWFIFLNMILDTILIKLFCNSSAGITHSCRIDIFCPSNFVSKLFQTCF